MIFKADTLSVDDPYEAYVRDRIRQIVEKANQSHKAFSGDFYGILQETLESMEDFKTNNWDGLDHEMERDPAKINNFFLLLKRANALNNLRSVKLREHIQFLADHIERTSRKMNVMISKMDPLMAAAEGALVTSATQSIRGETNIAVSFDNTDSVASTSLSINTDEGCMTVPAIATDDIPYITPGKSSIKMNSDKMLVDKTTNVNIPTSQLYTPGHYFGKFFDISPEFADEPAIDTIEKEDAGVFYAESYTSGQLQMGLTIRFVGRVNHLGIMNIKMGKCSGYPSISKVEVRQGDAANFIDITDSVTAKGINRVSLRNREFSGRILPGTSHDFPRIRMTINKRNVQEIRLQFVVDGSSPAEYIEYDLIDEQDNVIRTFNYLESLYISGYVFPDNFDVKRAKIDPAGIDEEIKGGKLIRNVRVIDKTFITINSVAFSGIQMGSIGSYTSVPFGRGNEIHSVEIYSDELVPYGMNANMVSYFVSTDGDTYIPIHPINRPNPQGNKTRLIFDPRRKDREQVPATGAVRIKVGIVNGGMQDTPRLYGYIVRIKETFGL